MPDIRGFLLAVGNIVIKALDSDFEKTLPIYSWQVGCVTDHNIMEFRVLLQHETLKNSMFPIWSDPFQWIPYIATIVCTQLRSVDMNAFSSVRLKICVNSYQDDKDVVVSSDLKELVDTVMEDFENSKPRHELFGHIMAIMEFEN